MNILYNILRGAAVGVATIVCLFAFSGSPSLFGRECGENDMESWKDIPEYEGLYQASSEGRVRSLNKHGADGRFIKGGVMSPSISGNGYLSIGLRKQGKRRFYSVHRLIAESFIGPSELQVDHKDGDRLNNKVENLQYLTPRANVSKSRLGMKKTSKYIGVRKYRNKWVAAIEVNGKKEILGSFDLEYDAHLAYKKRLGELIEL